ncbi:MAG: molybdopterin-binding protein [Sulfolobus sp.]
MRAILNDQELLLASDALNRFINELPPQPIGVEEVELLNSLGRISAENVYSPIDLPPFSRSTVDGYAIIANRTPGEFRVIDSIRIGEYKEIIINEGEAVEVDTGAVIPRNATAVIKVEEVEKIGDKIRIPRKVRFGENVGWIGSDIPKGTLILRKGEKIGPEKITLLASVGISKVKVFKKVKIFIITTGDELVQPGEELKNGKIYESNSYYLSSYLTLKGYEIVGKTHIGDDKEKIRDALINALAVADVVILTGGTSAGEKDYVHEVIKEEGKIVVHGLKFKPGKPTILGIVKGKPVFGLPGNVVSTIMVTQQVIEKYLALMGGYNGEIENTVEAILMNSVKADKNRFTYIPVFLFEKGGKYYALAVDFDSYMIGTFANADGYIGLSPSTIINEGETVKVILKSLDKRPVYIGEEDKYLMSLLGEEVRKLPLGSYAGLKALKYGVGDVIVVSSLYEDVSGEDFSFVRRIIETEGSDLIGYHEWIGLSKLTPSSSVKLRYVSIALSFIGKAKVIIPETFSISGKVIGEEKLKVFIKNESLRKYFEKSH